MGITLRLLYGNFEDQIKLLFPKIAAMITDIGYLHYYRNQLQWLINNLPFQLKGVEDNLCIPLTSVSPHTARSHRTL